MPDGRDFYPWELDVIKRAVADASAGKSVPFQGTADSLQARLDQTARAMRIPNYTPGFTPAEADYWVSKYHQPYAPGQPTRTAVTPTATATPSVAPSQAMPASIPSAKTDVSAPSNAIANQLLSSHAPTHAAPPSAMTPRARALYEQYVAGGQAAKTGENQLEAAQSAEASIPTMNRPPVSFDYSPIFAAINPTGSAGVGAMMGLKPAPAPSAPRTVTVQPPGQGQVGQAALYGAAKIAKGVQSALDVASSPQKLAGAVGSAVAGAGKAAAGEAVALATGKTNIGYQVADFYKNYGLHLYRQYLKPGWKTGLVNALADPDVTASDVANAIFVKNFVQAGAKVLEANGAYQAARGATRRLAIEAPAEAATGPYSVEIEPRSAASNNPKALPARGTPESGGAESAPPESEGPLAPKTPKSPKPKPSAPVAPMRPVQASPEVSPEASTPTIEPQASPVESPAPEPSVAPAKYQPTETVRTLNGDLAQVVKVIPLAAGVSYLVRLTEGPYAGQSVPLWEHQLAPVSPNPASRPSVAPSPQPNAPQAPSVAPASTRSASTPSAPVIPQESASDLRPSFGSQGKNDLGLPPNADGTVTLYHATDDEGVDALRKTGFFKPNGKDVYLTADATKPTKPGEHVVAVSVSPHDLKPVISQDGGIEGYTLSPSDYGGMVPGKYAGEGIPSVRPEAAPSAPAKPWGKPYAPSQYAQDNGKIVGWVNANKFLAEQLGVNDVMADGLRELVGQPGKPRRSGAATYDATALHQAAKAWIDANGSDPATLKAALDAKSVHATPGPILIPLPEKDKEKEENPQPKSETAPKPANAPATPQAKPESTTAAALTHEDMFERSRRYSAPEGTEERVIPFVEKNADGTGRYLLMNAHDGTRFGEATTDWEEIKARADAENRRLAEAESIRQKGVQEKANRVNGLPMTQYEPESGELSASKHAGGESGWYFNESVPSLGGSGYGSEAIILKGAKPSKVHPKNNLKLEDAILNSHANQMMKPLKPIAFTDGFFVKDGDTTSRKVWFDNRRAMSADLYDHILKAYPDAEFLTNSAGDFVAVRSKGELVGVAHAFIPIKNIPAGVTALLKANAQAKRKTNPEIAKEAKKRSEEAAPAPAEAPNPEAKPETAPPAKEEEKPSETAKPVAAKEETPASKEPEGTLPGTAKLVSILYDLIQSKREFDNATLRNAAEDAFGGSLASGAFGSRDMYDSLEAAVNLWVIKHSDIINGDPEKALQELRAMMNRIPTQTIRTSDQVELQQFSTPPTEAFVAAKALGIRPGDVVLEPSAGVGGLAAFAKAMGATVETNEIDPRRRALLEILGFHPTDVDAEFLDDVLPESVQPTVILMNPPFSATGGRVKNHSTKFGARHVESALKRLAPGGRLVAIVGQGMRLDAPEEAGHRVATGAAFKPWWERISKEFNVRANLSIPGAEYAKYGTTFGNNLLIIDKDGPTPGATFEERLSHIIARPVKDLKEALNVIRPIASDRPSAKESAGGVAASPERVHPSSGRAGVSTSRGGVIHVPRGSGAARSGVSTEQAGPAEGTQAVPEGEPGNQALRHPGGETVRSGGGTAENAGGRSTAAQNDQEGASELQVGLTETEPETGGFVAYAPAKMKKGTTHPGNIVETVTMAAVDPPDISYSPKIPSKAIESGKVSGVQLEAIAYAGQRFEQTLPDGSRAGFLLGDGTGVGKGRTIAAIIADAFNHGAKRALWVSHSGDLIEDAKGDFNEAGVAIPPIHDIHDLKKGTDFAEKAPVGLIFTTYDSLVSKQVDIIKWLGSDSIVAFDEAHKAKNAVPEGKKSDASRTGTAVVDLQAKLPRARILYSSATGMTDVRNMGYMSRLGLWGRGTPFPTFLDFMNEIDSGGVGAMEMIARDMKALGMYVSRSLSYEGVEYEDSTHVLTPEQRKAYDAAARAWKVVLQNVEKAVGVTNCGGLARGRAMSAFYSTQQQFFSQILMAFKLPTLIKEIEFALEHGQSPVVSFISTGESKMKTATDAAAARGEGFDDLDLSPLANLVGFVEKSFPTQLHAEETDSLTNKTKMVPVTDAEGKPVESREAVAMRDALIEELRQLALPDAPLDALIDYFGEENVAEMTGRTKRLKVNPETGKKELLKRGGYKRNVSMDKLNLAEMDAFQSGRKKIALISGAASTGISLQAKKGIGNQGRRRHITWQTDWSADKQMQFFGRTHRSNETSAPIYVLLATDAGGEKRFMSTIARRLASLGALTKGSREATSGGDLGRFNFETNEGRAALKIVIDAMERDADIPGVSHPNQLLVDMGLKKVDAKGGLKEVTDEDATNVTRFLNRVLALELNQQNALFDHFSNTLAQVIAAAKESGAFDEGIEDVKGENIRVANRQIVATDPTTKAETTHYEVNYDVKTTPVPWKKAEGTPYRQKRSKHLVVARPIGNRTDAATGSIYEAFSVTTPKKANDHIIPRSDLDMKYEEVPPDEAKSEWDKIVAEMPKHETESLHVIGGAVLPLWDRLRTAGATRLRVVRAVTTKKERVVGIAIPSAQVNRVLRALGVSSATNRSGEEIFSDIMRGETVELAGGISLRRGSLFGRQVIDLVNARSALAPELKDIGVREETVSWVKRLYVPNDPIVGPEILDKLLDRFPELGAETPERNSESGRVGVGPLIGLAALAGGAALAGIAAHHGVHPGTLAGAALVMPDVLGAAKRIANVARMYLAPETISGPARETADIQRHYNALMKQDNEIIRTVVRPSRALFQKFVEKKDHAFLLNFFDAMEGVQGAMATLPPNFQFIAKLYRDELDAFRVKYQRETGKLKNFIDDYFPHRWVETAPTGKSGQPSKGPGGSYAGRQSFLKKRKIDTTREGVEGAGLTPVNWNPADALMSVIAEMSKSMFAHRVKKEMAKAGYLKFVKRGSKNVAPGWAKIDDNFFNVWSPTLRAKMNPTGEYDGPNGKFDLVRDAPVNRGSYYAPRDAARVMNVWTQRGISDWEGIGPIYDWFLKRKYEFMHLILGLSGFHYGATAYHATVQQAANALEASGDGDIATALRAMNLTESGAVGFPRIGSRMEAEYKLPGSQSKEIQEAVKTLVKGGGSPLPPSEYGLGEAIEKIRMNYAEGNVVKSGAGAIPAGMDALSYPLFRWLVPWTKAGIFANKWPGELDRLAKEYGGEDKIPERVIRREAHKIVAHLDNVFGQMNYQNIIMPRVVKDLWFLAMNNPGWGVGTWRIGFGALGDLLKMPIESFGKTVRHATASGSVSVQTRKTRLRVGHGQAFVLALLAATAATNGCITWAMTGKWPKEPLDYMYPRDGTTDENGKPGRLTYGSYFFEGAKALHEFPHGVPRYLGGKVNSGIRMASDLAQNKDFRGNEIVTPSLSPFPESLKDLPSQAGEVGRYLASQAIPISVRGAYQESARGGSGIASFFGIYPASSHVTDTRAETLAKDLSSKNFSDAPKPRTQADIADLRRAAMSAMGSGDRATGEATLRELFDAGAISETAFRNSLKGVGRTPLQSNFQGLSLTDKMRVLRVASSPEIASLWIQFLLAVAGPQGRGTQALRTLAAGISQAELQNFLSLIQDADYRSNPSPKEVARLREVLDATMKAQRSRVSDALQAIRNARESKAMGSP